MEPRAIIISTPLLDSALLNESELGPDADEFAARAGMVKFPEEVTVESAREVSRILRTDIRGHQVVIFDLSETLRVDDSAAIIISELVGLATRRLPHQVIVCGLAGEVEKSMNNHGQWDRLTRDNFVPDLDAAKKRARDILLELD